MLRKSGPITSRKLPTLYLCEFSYISVFLGSFLSLKARYTGRSLFTRVVLHALTKMASCFEI